MTDPFTLRLAEIRTSEATPKLQELIKLKRSLDFQLYDMTQTLIKGGIVNSKEYEALRSRISAIDKDILEMNETIRKTGKNYVLLEKKDSLTKLPSPKKPTKNKRVIKKGVGKDVLKQDEVKELIQINKDILKKFKFKTVEECQSSKRSQPYYMSKENILKTIDENPDIKSLMPSKYKTMKKEDLCDNIFSVSKKN